MVEMKLLVDFYGVYKWWVRITNILYMYRPFKQIDKISTYAKYMLHVLFKLYLLMKQ